MIAQLSNSSAVHILYVNRTRDGHTSASVEVNSGGLYQVTIFALQGRRGIVDSDAEYRRTIMVTRAPNMPGSNSNILYKHTSYSMKLHIVYSRVASLIRVTF